MGLVLVSGAFALFLTRPKQPEAIREALLTEIFRTNGLVFKKGESKPFSGALLDVGLAGEVVSRTLLKGGLINGISEGWYTNGILQVREYFVDGVEEGLREKWYPDGTPMLKGTLVAGKFEGVFERWHTNGQIAETMTMRDGKPDGEVTSYYPSGYKKTLTVLKGGVLISQTSWKDGEARDSDPVARN
jgi:antitoxin component YwqK of YwqJK toxin-antitoxin module